MVATQDDTTDAQTPEIVVVKDDVVAACEANEQADEHQYLVMVDSDGVADVVDASDYNTDSPAVTDPRMLLTDDREELRDEISPNAFGAVVDVLPVERVLFGGGA